MWEGRIPLSSVTWTYDPKKHFWFPPSFEERRLQIWYSMLSHYPHLYDGEILVLDHFFLEKGILRLSTRSVRFSKILVHMKDNLKFPKYGSLGFQAIVTDPTHSYLLIGKRSHFSEYKPGYHTIPGGMFEKSDINNSLIDACLRELTEEISIDINPKSFYLIAMLLEANHLGTCLLVEVETKEKLSSSNNHESKILGNEEWENNQLEWILFSQICDLDQKRILEGLDFLRMRLIKQKGSFE
ncbi:MAG: NUDIX domain-containing protein [Promethearchaeota archaeon]